ncbi:MAG TPA: Vacuolar H+transporting two-sector ATPase F subunit [bacterium]|nr:Vacuolar H+transporting two-sector ATPase F subunit [bacterium]
MKFRVIADAETVLGFRLAGIEGSVVNSSEEALDALKEALNGREVGIILITERVAQTIRHEVDRLLYSTTFPLILEIPDSRGALEGRGNIRDWVRSAVGITL